MHINFIFKINNLHFILLLTLPRATSNIHTKSRIFIEEKMTPFAISLHMLRIRKGRLQTDLCDAVGVDRARISCWERGLRPAPNLEMIERLCLELGADGVEAAELREAAKFSGKTVQIPADTIPELYPLIHRLVSAAGNFTRADASTLENALSHLNEYKQT